MELAASAALARHAVLGGERRICLQHVPVRVDVDRGAEARVRRRAVIALEEVLHGDLPVRVQLHVHARMEDELRQVEIAGHELRHDSERVGERRRVGIRVHEQERPPHVGARRDQRPVGVVELRLALRARRLAEPPVQLVRPGVVRALKRLPAATPLHERGAPVAADVQEGAQLADPVAHDEKRDVAAVGREKRARLGDLLGAARVLPCAREDPSLLAPQDPRVGVPREGQRRPPLDVAVLDVGPNRHAVDCT
jgi:hypothetical protein